MAKPPNKKAGKLTPIREVSHYEIRHIDTKEIVGKSANNMSASKALKRYGSKSHYSAPVYKDEIEAEKAKKKAQREAERDERKSIEEAKRKVEREKKNATLAQKREAEKVKREAERNKKKAERDSEREAKKAQREAEKAERDALRQAEREAKKTERQNKQKLKRKWGLTASEYEKYHADSVKESKSYNKKEPIKDEKGKFTTDVENIIRMVVDNADTMDSETRRKYLKFIRGKIPSTRYREIVDSLPESTIRYTHDGNSKRSSEKRLERERNNRDSNEAIRPMHGPTGNKLPEEPETTSDPTKPKRRLFKGFGRGILGFAAGIKDGARDITRHAASNMWRQYKQNFRKVLLHGGEGSFHPIDRRYKETWIGSKAGITSSSGGTNTAKTMGSAGARSRITDGINKVNAQLEDVVLSTRRIENTLNKLLYAQVNNTKEQSINNAEGEEGKSRENGGWRGLLGGPRPTGVGSTRGTRNAIRFGRGLIRYGGPALAVLGGGMSAANEFGESGNIGRAASTGIGSTVGAVGGGWAGAKAGALLGTAIAPGLGTAIGGLGGMLLGGYLGSHAGEATGRFGYDAVTQNGRETEQSLRNNETRNRLLNNTNSEMSIISSTYSVNARSDISFTTPTKLHFKAGSIVFEGSITTGNSSSNTGTPTIPQSNGSPNIGNIPGIGQIPNQGSATGPQIGTPQSPQGNGAPQGTASGVRRSNVFRGGNAGGDRGIPQSTATGPQSPVIQGFGNNSVGGGLFGPIPNGQGSPSPLPDQRQIQGQMRTSPGFGNSDLLRSIPISPNAPNGPATEARRQALQNAQPSPGASFSRGDITDEEYARIRGGANWALRNMPDPTTDAVRGNLTTIRSPSGQRFTVHREAAADLQGFINELEGSGYRINPGSGGYNLRRNVNNPSQWSTHSYGTTLDINPTQNPNRRDGVLQTNLPPNISRMAARYNISWGGDWRSVKDAMHFEWMGSQNRPSNLIQPNDPNHPSRQQANGNVTTPQVLSREQVADAERSEAHNRFRHHPNNPFGWRSETGGRQNQNQPQFQPQTPEEFARASGLNPNDMPAGMRNNNPGNLIHTNRSNYPGLVGPSTNTDQGRRQSVFNSPRAGVSAMHGLLMRRFGEGRDTINKIIAERGGWTPGNYRAATNIARMAGVRPNEKIDLNNPDIRRRVMQAIVRQEHGNAGRAYNSLIDEHIAGPQQNNQTPATPGNDIKYQAEILNMNDPRTDPKPAPANTPRSFQQLPEDAAQQGSNFTAIGRQSLASTGANYIAQRRAASTTPPPRPFQNLPEDSGQQGSNFVATGREFLHGNGANYVAQRRAASTTPPPRPFQGLPEDGMQQGSNFTAIGRQALATSAASYIAQRRASQQAQQIQFAQRAIEDGKMANKMAIEQSLPPPSQSRGSPSATETSRPTTPQSNAPTRMTAPSETATPSGRFAEELNSRGSGAIVEPIENSNMSLQKSANKISQ